MQSMNNQALLKPSKNKPFLGLPVQVHSQSLGQSAPTMTVHISHAVYTTASYLSSSTAVNGDGTAGLIAPLSHAYVCCKVS